MSQRSSKSELRRGRRLTCSLRAQVRLEVSLSRVPILLRLTKLTKVAQWALVMCLMVAVLAGNSSWSCGVPPTISHGGWLRIPFRLGRINTRGVKLTNLCPICSVEMEDNFHLLCRCPLARELGNLWRKCGGYLVLHLSATPTKMAYACS